MNELKSGVITISKVEQQSTNSGIMLKIMDTEEKKYTVFQKKMDGGDTMAYKALSNIPSNGVGLTFDIAFKEDPKEFNGHPYVARTIMKMVQRAGQTNINTQQTIQAPSMQVSSSPQKSQRDGDAEGKVRFGFAVKAYELGLELNQTTVTTINDWTKFVMTGELPDELVSSMISEFGGEEISGDEVKIEDIPF